MLTRVIKWRPGDSGCHRPSARPVGWPVASVVSRGAFRATEILTLIFRR